MTTPNTHLEPELLSAYLDDEVTLAERQLIEAHLPTCADCQKELASLRFTVALVQSLPPRPIPRPFYVTEAMVTPAAAQTPQTAGWWGWLRGLAPFGGALAALLVVVVAGTLLNGMGSGGAAMPAATTAFETGETGIAMAPTEEVGVMESSAPADATTADSANDAEAETRILEATEESGAAAGTVQDATPDADVTYSITATDQVAPESDVTAMTDTEEPVLATVEEQETARKNSEVSPFAMNTILIVALVLALLIGGAVILSRRRPS
jgi:hypothetical protein